MFVHLCSFRSAFRSALLDLITAEHSNLFGKRGRPNGTILGTKRQEVAEWKFATLDKNRDGDLESAEVRGWWREAVRRVVRPRKCARDWMSFCDQDGDNRVTSKEWSSCLGASENSEFPYLKDSSLTSAKTLLQVECKHC